MPDEDDSRTGAAEAQPNEALVVEVERLPDGRAIRYYSRQVPDRDMG